MNENIFDKLDFGPFRSLLDNDDITDISYDNNGQIWVRSLTQGSMRVEIEGATPDFVEKLAFQCSNVMGTTFNNAKPFLDAESAELRMNFVHQSIATNGIALVIRKTPAKIRLEKEKLLKEDYFTPAIHDLLIKCVQGHCNIMVAGETGSGKTEFVKYLASHTITSEKIITIEDTLELHLDKIYPQRDIVSMKTNNVASYSDVLVTCMRQNPKWILLSEVRSAEAVSAVRNSISSGHNILSTIHADKASAIPYRLYSLMETDLDVNQFLNTIYRYIQMGVHIKAFYSKQYGKFHRELDEVCEFFVDDDNVPKSRIIYQKIMGKMIMCKPSKHLQEYLSNQNIDISEIIENLPDELPIVEMKDGEAVVEDAESVTEPPTGPEVGESTSIPEVGEDGNVKLSETVVKKSDGSIDGESSDKEEDNSNEEKQEESGENKEESTPPTTPEVQAQPEVPTTPEIQPQTAQPNQEVQQQPIETPQQPAADVQNQTNEVPGPQVQTNVVQQQPLEQAPPSPTQQPTQVVQQPSQPMESAAPAAPQQLQSLAPTPAQPAGPAQLNAAQVPNVVPNLVRLDG